jgi:hypothetical protein
MPDFSNYVVLMQAAVAGRMSLKDFSVTYMRMFQDDVTTYDEPTFEILNHVFLDSDEFEPSAPLYDELKQYNPDFVISSQEYLARISAALQKLASRLS